VSFHTVSQQAQASIPLIPLKQKDLEEWLVTASQRHRRWCSACGFNASPGQVLALPDEEGNVQSYLFGMQPDGWLYQLSPIFEKLPQGHYLLSSDWTENQVFQASVGWGLSAYRFDRYKKISRTSLSLQLSEDLYERITSVCCAQNQVRDLVNTPTEHMGPEHLAEATQAAAERFGASYKVIAGDELLNENFPSIHAVGRASSSAPRLLELTWGDEDAPLLALVGKGVCFDTGGLDLKSTAGMALMKKDMGGAAHVLALANLVMQHQLPVRLLLLIPAVENSVAGNAYRPGDVIATRKGLSVEVGNTDAEGRVVLSDALTYACEHEPDLVMDFATLTGAARIALGTDLPPLFSNRAEVAARYHTGG
jgi:leucyl aminopeptidase